MGDDLKNNIINYVQIDNQINEYKNKINELKEEMNSIISRRDNFESNIIRIIESNKLEKKDIIISDGKIKYNQSKTATPITKKHIENCLIKYFNNKDKATELLDIIYNERKINTKTSIKRYMNK